MTWTIGAVALAGVVALAVENIRLQRRVRAIEAQRCPYVEAGWPKRPRASSA